MLKKHLSEPWFSLVRDGKKTVEGRLDQGEWSRLKTGDTIEWYNSDTGSKRPIQTKVVGILCYLSFESLILSEGLEFILPTISTLEEGKEVYEKIYGCNPSSTILGIKLQRF